MAAMIPTSSLDSVEGAQNAGSGRRCQARRVPQTTGDDVRAGVRVGMIAAQRAAELDQIAHTTGD